MDQLDSNENSSFIKSLFFIVISALFILMLNIQYGQFLLPSLTGDSYDMRRVYQLIFIFLLGLALCCNTKWRNQCIIQFCALPSFARYCIYAFFILGLVSSSFIDLGANYLTLPKQAFLEVALYIAFFLNGLLISQWFQNNPSKFKDWAMFIVFIMIALYILMVWLHIINFKLSLSKSTSNISIQSQTVWTYIMAPFFANIRFLSQFMTWTWPLLVLPLITKNKLSFIIKAVIFIVMVLWFFQIILLQGRSNFLEFIIVPIVLSIMFGKKAIPWIKWQAVALIIGIIIWYLIYMNLLGGSFRHDFEITEHTGRWFIYLSSLKLALSHPILGVGPMHLSASQVSLGSETGWIATPHNVLCKIVAEWGIPAFIIFCIIVCMALYKWAKLSIQQVRLKEQNEQNFNDSVLFICLNASIISGLIHSMLSGVTTMPLSQVTMVLILGWSWGLYQLKCDDKSLIFKIRDGNKINPIKNLLFVILLIYLALLINRGVFPRVYYIKWANAISQYRTGGMLAPRFWGQGVLELYPLVNYY